MRSNTSQPMIPDALDIIAQSIKKDPAVAANYQEIHRRLCSNLMILTSHTIYPLTGEYGRTHHPYKYPVSEDKVPNKAHLLTNEDGTSFDYPYFIHDSMIRVTRSTILTGPKATDSRNS